MNDLEMKDPYFKDKLKYYKTAFSPLHNQFVAIKNHYFDADGELVILAELADKSAKIMFREENRKMLFFQCELMMERIERSDSLSNYVL